MRVVAVLAVMGLLTAWGGRGAPLGSTSIVGLDTVGCGAKSAWAKVIANVVLNCPAGATQSVTDIHHYPSTTCLRRL